MLKPFVQERDEGKITEEKLTRYKAEFSSRICFWSIFIAFWFMMLAGLTPRFITFIIFFAAGMSFLVTSVGVLYIGIMSS